MFNDAWGQIAALVIFVGFNLTFFPQFMAGGPGEGMPRRYYDYTVLLPHHPEIWPYNVLSTIGSYVLAVGLVMIPIYLLHSLFGGRRAPANPWGGATLEWQCSSPPPPENFASPPTAGDPYDFSDLVYDAETGGYVRKAEGGRRKDEG
jgi:cytochrome c oxidase subunit I